VLKTVPVEQLQNKHLRIQGNAASSNEIIKLWEQKHNVSITHNITSRWFVSQTDHSVQDKLEVEYRSTKELDDRVNADKNDFLAILLQEWASGRGEIGGCILAGSLIPSRAFCKLNM
jgi:predicted HTH transcriptional regulator